MPHLTSRPVKYPGHWPVHASGMPGVRQQLPLPGPPAPVEATPAAAPAVERGELAASPWVGLHYATENHAAENHAADGT
jgi:hypothetical protein